MDLERLKIDRGARAGGGRRRRGGPVKWLVVLAVLAVAGFLLRAPLGRLYDRITLPAVEVVRAVETTPGAASVVSGTAANGYIVAARRAALSADTPGRVVEMNVEEGSVVEKGDVVARLYSEEYEAAVRRAEAEQAAARSAVARARAEREAARARLATLETTVAAAKAQVDDAKSFADRAQTDFERFQRLLASGAATQQDVDDAQTKLDRARSELQRQQALLRVAEARVTEGRSDVETQTAAVAEAEAQLAIRKAERDQAEATLAKTSVRAPFDGIVILKDAEVGEVVSPNSQGGSSRGAVVTMVDFASLEVQVELPETRLSAVEVGARALIYLDAYPETAYPGKVERIWPTANRQKGTVELRVGFEKPDGRLRPDMSVRVVFSEETPEQPAEAQAPVVLVPESCIVRRDGGAGVFLLEGNRARYRAVDVGERKGGRVVVRSGLEGGEDVVLEPPSDLEDGARVRAP